MLFFVELLGIIQRDVSNIAVSTGLLIITGAENSIFEEIDTAQNSTECLLAKGYHLLVTTGNLQYCIRPTLSKQDIIGAGYHITIRINDTKYTIRCIL